MMTDLPMPLRGTLMLLIDEEMFLADYIGRGLADAGAQIIGPARTVAEADALLSRLRVAPVAAIVSIRLFEADGGTVGDGLSRLGVPILLINKNERCLPASLRHDVLTVPFAAYQVVEHMCRLIGAQC